MSKPQDEFSVVEFESDEFGDEAFEAPIDDTQSLLRSPMAVDKFVCVTDFYEAQGEALKKRGDEMKRAGQSRINWAKNAKAVVRDQMKQDETTEVLGVDFKLCWQKTKPKLVIDEAQIPEEYRTTKTVVVIDEEAVRRDLEAGLAITGAKLEVTGSLRIRPNTKKIEVA